MNVAMHASAKLTQTPGETGVALKIALAWVVGAMLMTAAGCAVRPTPLPGPAPTVKAVDFDYFGKITIGDPTFNRNVARLPLIFEGGPWEQARGVAIGEVHGVLTDREILITALVVEHGDTERTVSNQQGLLLTGIRQGIYDVYYQDRLDPKKHRSIADTRHKIGRTVIKKSLVE